MFSPNDQLPERKLFDCDELYGEGRSVTIFQRRLPQIFFGPDSPTKVKLPRGMYARGKKLETLIALLADGKSNSQIERETRTGTKVVAKLRNVLETHAGKPFLCPCGKPASHTNYCAISAGKRPGLFKLDPEKVRYIRTHYVPGKTSFVFFAEMFGVNPSVIGDALLGKTWAHIQNPGPVKSASRDFEERRQKAARLLRNGISCTLTARRVDMDRNCVIRIWRELGLPRFNRILTPERQATRRAAIQLLQQGISARKTAQITKMPERHVYALRHELGIAPSTHELRFAA
jgi:transposase-like protein